MQETDFSLGSAFGLNNSLITPRKNRPQKTEGEEIVSEMENIALNKTTGTNAFWWQAQDCQELKNLGGII